MRGLADIGLTESQRRRECAKWFWQIGGDDEMVTKTRPQAFYGWRVVGAAFVLAVSGWGTGFYGPPIFLRVIGETRGWPLAVVSTAVGLASRWGCPNTGVYPMSYAEIPYTSEPGQRGHHPQDLNNLSVCIWGISETSAAGAEP